MAEDKSDIEYHNTLFNKYRFVEKEVTLVGTLNANGDFDGTGNPSDLFTVTGTVIARVIAVCSTNVTIAAGGTLEVGVTGGTAGLIALTAGDAIDAGEIWHDASPDSKIELSSVGVENIITSDIILTAATANITAGVIKFFAIWKPVSKDGNVVAA